MPAATISRAMKVLEERAGRPERLSGLWRCAPAGPVPQPPFLNAVLLLRTHLPPHELLGVLHAVENLAGRRRGRRWGARALDLDLLDHGGRVSRPVGAGGRMQGLRTHHLQSRGLFLPHPDIAARAFVLLPLVEVMPEWRHPVTGRTASQMLARIPGRIRALCHRIGEIS